MPSNLSVMSSRSTLLSGVMTLGCLVAPTRVPACTVCDSENAAAVRQAFVADDDFALNLLAAALPPLAFAGVVTVAYLRWPAQRR